MNFVCLLVFRRSQGVEFVLVALGNERSALGQFGIEPSPDMLLIVLVLR
jgi:hypothetical protein